MIARYDFFKTKYGEELLIDLIRLEDLEKYIRATPIHRLSYYDITVIDGGRGTFSIDGSEYPLRKGTVLFSAPGQIRKWNTTTTLKGYVVIFESEFLNGFFNDHGFVESLPLFNRPGTVGLKAGDYRHLTTILASIEAEIGTADRHMLRALLYQVLMFLSRRFNSNGKLLPNRYVDRFVQLVNDFYKEKRSATFYAGELNITVGHLTSLVREHFGTSTKQFILNRNILEARRLLQYTTMSVDQVAETLNYESTSYFVRAFKRQTGSTPLNFRKRADR